jgi:hypothetical protein
LWHFYKITQDRKRPEMLSIPPSQRWPWIMLLARTLLFIGFQALCAVGYWLAGSTAAWEAAANWWPFTATLANLACMVLLIGLFKGEGKRYRDILRIQRDTLKGDLLVMLGMVILFGPVGYLPGTFIANWLFGGMQIPNEMFIRPLPMWAAIFSLAIWPITQGLAELPTYFGYAMPRLEGQTGRAWLAVSLASLFLAAQHMAMPLLFDLRFIAWRGLMFLPFALMVGILLHWRPRLMPYMVIVHILIDAATAASLLSVGY